ncbi:DUF7696 family protein [Burkholderia gladioli]|uniref:DUF7696 family protein n=1 Tax=Burkholderia gladioli TaxID=28095 RepID=UPI001C24FD9F|nr:hypothetical protein [Burkholderia gladioli]MBU9175818.1 hypothetical protein [Burkholderia gladioli]
MSYDPNPIDEQHRHACEVRYVLSIESRAVRLAYLTAVEAKRGKEAAQHLRADVEQAWKNRGVRG